MSPRSAVDPVKLSSKIDTLHKQHLHALVKQCLDEAHISSDPWQSIIVNIGLMTTQDIPYILDSLQIAKVGSSANGLQFDLPSWLGHNSCKETKIDTPDYYWPRLQLSFQSSSNSNILPSVKHETKGLYYHTITVCTEDGQPSDSEFISSLDSLKYNLHNVCDGGESIHGQIRGQIILRGNSKDLCKLVPLMELVVYVACHQNLEVLLLQDMRMPHMIFNTTTSSVDGTCKPVSNTTNVANTGMVGSIKPSMWKWIWQKRCQSQSSQTNFNQATDLVSTLIVPNSQQSKLISWRIWPFDSSKQYRHTFESVADEQISRSDTFIKPTNQFDQAIQHIEQTILSSSPGVVFPSPPILVHLRDHESDQDIDTPQTYTHSTTPPSTPDRLVLLNRSVNHDFINQLMCKSESVTASHLKIAPKSPLSPGKITGKRSWISTDSQVKLSCLMKNNNAISGIMRHQSISFSFSYFCDAETAIPCYPSKVYTIRYYDKLSIGYQDCTLGQYIHFLCVNADRSCLSNTCPRAMGQHRMAYHHDEGCVLVSLAVSDNERLSHTDCRIFFWTSCTECSKLSDVTPLSTASWYYSFGKFLELIFYHHSFIPTGACQHILYDRSYIRRHFRFGKYTVLFEFFHMDLFEIRLPKINVYQDAASVQRKAGTHHVSYFEFEPDEDQINAIRQDIREFYQSLFVYLAAALQNVNSESVPSIWGSTETSDCILKKGLTNQPSSKERLSELLNDMTCMFADEQCHFLDAAVHSTDMNVLKRLLCKRMQERILSMDTLHKEYPILSTCCLSWKLPDYYINKHHLLHLVPSSSTIVRENEPSSIIAFTLSSKPFVEYMRTADLANYFPVINELEDHMQLKFSSDKDAWTSLGQDCKYRISRVSNSHTLDSKGKHINYEFADLRTSFSCTVYFAQEFNDVRKMCGVSEQYIKSLERSAPWNASGGKSAASFFKTTDDRFIMKELSSRWMSNEKDMLFKFIPKYFEYLVKSDRQPTLLTKILGFYTITKKNLSTGQTSVLDVIVMEHLFANVNISRKFDLKGVPDRHVVPQNVKRYGPVDTHDQVMWDGDWNSGQYRSLLRLFAHSKRILMESVYNDTDFLCQAQVMDYSLLVGVKNDTKELVVGIVDFIASFNWSKMLEMQGKTTLQSTLGSRKAVTVIPPDQYRDRFREAMEHNFLIVPDKWTDIALPDNGLVLPSVL
ncbi:hypothetical protein BDV3_000655 [Batrachochytrium dendrobatidis]